MSVEMRATTLRFHFKTLGTIVFDATLASAENNSFATMYGWKQRLADTAALSADPKQSLAERELAKYEEIEDICEYFMQGDVPWNRKGDGAGSLLIQAFMRVKNTTRERARAFLDSRTKEQLALIRKDAQIIRAEADIRLERSRNTGATSSALDDFDSMELDSELDSAAEDDSAE